MLPAKGLKGSNYQSLFAIHHLESTPEKIRAHGFMNHKTQERGISITSPSSLPSTVSHCLFARGWTQACQGLGPTSVDNNCKSQLDQGLQEQLMPSLQSPFPHTRVALSIHELLNHTL